MSMAFVNAFDAHIDAFPAVDYFHPPKPRDVTRTNADRIRAMTDEELAEFLCKNREGCRALTTESYVCDFYTDDLQTDCNACWLDWLRKESE